MLAAAAAAAAVAAAVVARYTIRSNITVQPSCFSTHSLCCVSCSMAWASSILEPSPKLAPQQQMKSSPSAGFRRRFVSKLSCRIRVVAGVPYTVEAVVILTTLS